MRKGIYKSDVVFILMLIAALITVVSGYYNGNLSLMFGTITFLLALLLGRFEKWTIQRNVQEDFKDQI